MTRAGLQTSEGRRANDAHRLVVLAIEPIEGDALVEEIARHACHPRDDVAVVAPALVDSPLKLGASAVDPAVVRAKRHLVAAVEALRRAGLHATGSVGDADPSVALADVLRSSPANEVIVTTRASETAAWLRDEVIERAQRELHTPITEVVVEPGRGVSSRVKEVRELLPHAREGEQQLDYLPPLALRDRVALVVGICGTITLGVLAMFAPGHTRGSLSAAFAVRFLIATGAFMVTLWHVVALLIFASVGYRGKWETFAAGIVLFGVPVAVALSLAIGYVFPPVAS